MRLQTTRIRGGLWRNPEQEHQRIVERLRSARSQIQKPPPVAKPPRTIKFTRPIVTVDQEYLRVLGRLRQSDRDAIKKKKPGRPYEL